MWKLKVAATYFTLELGGHTVRLAAVVQNSSLTKL